MSLLTIRAMAQAATIAGSPPITQNFNVASGPGESPKAAIYELTACTALDTALAPGKPGIGITDGVSQYALGMLYENAKLAAIADNDGRVDNATVVQYPLNASNAIGGEASWAQWNTDGSQLSWADKLGNASQIKATYFFGTGVSAAVASVTSPGTQDTDYSVTGLSFAPTMMIMLSIGAAWGADSAVTHARFGLGYACKNSYTGGILQAGTWTNGKDNTNNYSQNIYDTRIMRSIATTTNAESTGIEVKSINSDGATFTQRDDTTAVTTQILFLGLPKHRVWVGVPALTTTSTGNKSITEPQFNPKAYFLISTILQTKNAIDTNTQVLHIGHGIATGSESFCTAAQAENGAATTDTRSFFATKLVHLQDDAGGIEWAASHVSMGALGPVVNIDTASGADRLCVLCAVSEDPRTVPHLFKNRKRRLSSRRRRLAAA